MLSLSEVRKKRFLFRNASGDAFGSKSIQLLVIHVFPSNFVNNHFWRCFFQGTKNRKQAELEVEVDAMGGLLNAHISRELTVYYIKCFKSDMARGRQTLKFWMMII